MRLGVTIDYSEDFAGAAAEAVHFERAGIEVVAVSEAYSFDAVSRLGYLAAITSTATLMSSILPLYSRTPTLLAMTAASLDSLSGGRFELGLGSSGPQVIEGFHGVPFARPLGHLRETVEICRAVWRRERLEHSGQNYTIPLPEGQGTGLGKSLKLINRPFRSGIPVAIAALTPRAVEQTAEIADGWFPMFYHPERAAAAWGDSLAAGSARRDPSLGALDAIVSVPLFIGDDDERMLGAYRERMALYIGGMGAPGANFYNELAVRYGYGGEAERVQELYLAGEKTAAADALPDDLVLATSLIGTEAHVRERLAAFEASGATTLLVQPLAPTAAGRVESIEAVRAMLG
ncbi:LLM class F420-dependent oxidoreductase [Subtercola boreus]|uniref:LLM class F420-dependent oxidoreductase n=1 Tax=Subtercola boreus TaxID=120213 RepID=A0A3E0W7U0_9MICO|nr:LLM class F420-dependent oxidoreductase [Subtercola boreus]RFA19073.1 LLM class F420-dependent oxidoreductase [Subtercola boreus]RFA19211.1 LLM class F420-dependent oxidoreductase [Subtercola boreus]RFA25673.1 LLM class F420-dependent oxidoreductase [Subtercola boreus]